MDSAARRRTLSVRLGSVGLLLLFAGAIAILAYPVASLPLLGLMIVGIILLVVAFSFARPPIG